MSALSKSSAALRMKKRRLQSSQNQEQDRPPHSSANFNSEPFDWKPPTSHHKKKFNRHGITLPKISSLVSIRDQVTVMTKHQLRKDAITCTEKCGLNDFECKCSKLIECVKRMDAYDFAVLLGGGYIDTSQGKNHGNFKIATKDLNLFAYDLDIIQKLQEVQNLADSIGSNDQQQCSSLLSHFISACSPDEGERTMWN